MNKMMKKPHQPGSLQVTKIVISLIAVLFISACASVPAPTEQIAISNEAVKNANSAGSSEFAPVQFRSAMGKMEAANRAMQEKKYALARQLSEQAQVDAQLALEMTRAAKAQKASDALQEDNRVLRQEIDRKTK